MNYCRTCESSCCPGLHPLEKEGFHLHILFTQTLAQDGAFVCISFPSDLPLCVCVQLALSVLRWAFAIWKLMRKVSFDLLRLGSICQLLTNAFCAPPSYVTFLGCSAKMGEKMYSLEYIYQGLDD